MVLIAAGGWIIHSAKGTKMTDPTQFHMQRPDPVSHHAFRPHSSLGNLTPEEVAARHAEEKSLILSATE